MQLDYNSKKRRGYKFTNKKHPDGGIMAVILGVISLLSLGIVIYKSYAAGGAAQTGFGFTGILALLFAIIGLILGVLTIYEKNYYKLFPVLGIILNALVFAVLGIIMYAGTNF